MVSLAPSLMGGATGRDAREDIGHPPEGSAKERMFRDAHRREKLWSVFIYDRVARDAYAGPGPSSATALNLF